MSEGYTHPSLMAGFGSSAGGTLIGIFKKIKFLILLILIIFSFFIIK